MLQRRKKTEEISFRALPDYFGVQTSPDTTVCTGQWQDVRLASLGLVVLQPTEIAKADAKQSRAARISIGEKIGFYV